MPDDPSPATNTAVIRQLGRLTIKSERAGDTYNVALAGELDIAGAEPLGAELRRVEATDAQAIVLDLSALTFMDSSGLRVLLLAHNRSRSDRERLAMIRPDGAALRIVEVAGLLDTLPFRELGTDESSL